MNWLFVAGGTGGHIYPAISIADYLNEQRSEDKVMFLTSSKVLDQNIIAQAGYDYFCLEGKGFNQTNIIQKIKALLKSVVMFFKSLNFIRKHNIDIVFGIGGYMSAPVLLAGALAKKKTASLEPNVIPGLSNRLVATFVDHIFLAFEESAVLFNKEKTILSGNPIRKSIMDITPPTFEHQKLCILVFGGSQGAMQINDLVLECLPKLKKYEDKICFVHQTGKQGYEDVQAAYAKYNFEHQVFDYIHEMSQAYEKSDFIVARAGSSVLEIAACGRPSVLIPYPYAADNHQLANAQVMEKRKAAFVLNGVELTAEQLLPCLEQFICDSNLRQSMRDAALSLREENSAKTIVETLTTSGGAYG